MEKTTLKDLADHTGLSISTVSRILRGESKADSKNVAATIDAALELNYPLNVSYLNAKYNFKSKHDVALVTTFFPSEFYSTFFDGINSVARDAHVNVSLHDFDPEVPGADICEYIKNLIAQQIDAAILFLPTLHEEEYQRLLTEIPSTFILVSVLPSLHPVLDTITFDSYGGGYLVAQHFYEKGYREVGIINGPFNRNEALLRKNGFTDFIAQKHDMHLVWSYNGHFDFRDGMKAFNSFTQSLSRPKAIFSTNDMMCVGFLKMATQAGLSVPKDIALAGYDDLPVCQYVHPSITSVKTNYAALGKKAFTIISDKIAEVEHHSGMQSIIPVSLQVRDST